MPTYNPRVTNHALQSTLKATAHELHSWPELVEPLKPARRQKLAAKFFDYFQPTRSYLDWDPASLVTLAQLAQLHVRLAELNAQGDADNWTSTRGPHPVVSMVTAIQNQIIKLNTQLKFTVMQETARAMQNRAEKAAEFRYDSAKKNSGKAQPFDISGLLN